MIMVGLSNRRCRVQRRPLLLLPCLGLAALLLTQASTSLAETAGPSGPAVPLAEKAPHPVSSAAIMPGQGALGGEASGDGPKRVLPHAISPWGMFRDADIVVKGVMGLLAAASFVTWIIWIAKSIDIIRAKTQARRSLRLIGGAATLSDAAAGMARRKDDAALMLAAIGDEVQATGTLVDHAGGGGLKERTASVLARLQAAASGRLQRGTGILATIGSVSPFVGLFGTVWGIMNAFIGISETQTTNLAVVAPGIAEALLATAIGLVAAIPAVVIYNVFARSMADYRRMLADVAAAIERLVSRDIDVRFAARGTASGRAVAAAE